MTHTKYQPSDLVAIHERYKLCPQCANFCTFGEQHTYCMMCGSKFIVHCPNCIEPIIYPTARFCPGCGEGLVKNDGDRKVSEGDL